MVDVNKIKSEIEGLIGSFDLQSSHATTQPTAPDVPGTPPDMMPSHDEMSIRPDTGEVVESTVEPVENTEVDVDKPIAAKQEVERNRRQAEQDTMSDMDPTMVDPTVEDPTAQSLEDLNGENGDKIDGLEEMPEDGGMPEDALPEGQPEFKMSKQQEEAFQATVEREDFKQKTRDMAEVVTGERKDAPFVAEATAVLGDIVLGGLSDMAVDTTETVTNLYGEVWHKPVSKGLNAVYNYGRKFLGASDETDFIDEEQFSDISLQKFKPKGSDNAAIQTARGLVAFASSFYTGGAGFKALGIGTKLAKTGKLNYAVNVMGKGAVADYIVTTSDQERLLQMGEKMGGPWAAMIPDYLGAEDPEDISILEKKLKGLIEGALLGGALDGVGKGLKAGTPALKNAVEEVFSRMRGVKEAKAVADAATNVKEAPEIIAAKNDIKKAAKEFEAETSGAPGPTIDDSVNENILKSAGDEADEAIAKQADEVVDPDDIDVFDEAAKGTPVEPPKRPENLFEAVEQNTQKNIDELKEAGMSDADLIIAGDVSDYAGLRDVNGKPVTNITTKMAADKLVELNQSLKEIPIGKKTTSDDVLQEVDGIEYLDLNKMNADVSLKRLMKEKAIEANESIGAQGLTKKQMRKMGEEALDDIAGFLGRRPDIPLEPGQAVAARRMLLASQNTLTKLAHKAARLDASKADMAAFIKARNAKVDLGDIIMRGRKATGQSLNAFNTTTNAGTVLEGAGGNIGIVLKNGDQIGGARIVKNGAEANPKKLVEMEPADLADALNEYGRPKAGYSVVDADGNIVRAKDIKDFGIDPEAVKNARVKKVTYKQALEREKEIDAILKNEKYSPEQQALLISDIARQSPEKLSMAIKAMEDCVYGRGVWGRIANMSGKVINDLHAIRINFMLSNPGTHVTNILSNFLTATTAIPEAGMSKAFRGDLSGAGKDMVNQTIGLWTGFMEAWPMMFGKNRNEALEMGTKLDAFGSGARSASAFEGSDNPLAKAWTMFMKGVQLPGSALEKGDILFKSMSYRANMYREVGETVERMVRSGDIALKDKDAMIKDMLANPTDDIIENSIKEARYRTFTNEIADDAKVAKGLQALSRNPFGALIMPFFRTPYNIVRYSAERVPGLNFVMKEQRRILTQGTAKERGDMAARLMLGSGIGLTAMMLAKDGIITGKAPHNKSERNAFYAAGKQEYSIRIPGTDRWVSYKRYEPLATVLSLGADVSILAGEDSDDTEYGWAVTVLASLSASVLDNTFLSGISNTITALNYGEAGTAYWLQSMASTFAPGTGGYIDKLADGKSYDIRVDRDTGTGEAMVDAFRNRFGLNNDLPVKRDFWGQPIKTVKDDIGSKILYGLGVRSSLEKDNKLDQMVYESGVGISDVYRKINGVDLTTEEYQRYKELIGKRLRERMEALVNTGKFDDQYIGEGSPFELMFDKEKGKARSWAKERILKESPELNQLIFERKAEREGTKQSQKAFNMKEVYNAANLKKQW